MNKLPALYEIAANYKDIADQLAAMDLPDDVVADTLEAEGGDLQEKCVNVAMVARNLESSADQIQAAIEQMQARQKAMKNRADRIRDYLLHHMAQCDIQSVECPYFKVSIAKKPPSVDVLDEKQIPADYIKTRTVESLDKAGVLRDLKAGKEIPGAKLKQGRRLNIK